MATNPIRKEENKWTPKSIFDINLGSTPIPLESIFSQGSDGVNVEEAKESLETGSNSFFKNFLSNAINRVAEAFSPDGDKHHIIEEAVTEQIGPTYNAIEEAQKRQEELAGQVAESMAAQETILAESQDVLAKAEEAAQSLEGVEAELEKAQNDLIAQGIRFDEEQAKINELVQETIWNHQDVLEMMDIRAQKTWGWTAEDFESAERSFIPGQPVDPVGTIGGDYAPVKKTPYVRVWKNSKREIFLATVGNWTGNVRVSINWSNGALDDWVVPVPGYSGVVRQYEQKGTTVRFYGGSLSISIRSIAVEVQVSSLNRYSQFQISTRPYAVDPEKVDFYGILDVAEDAGYHRIEGTALDRELVGEGGPLKITEGKIRLKGPFVADKDIPVVTPDGIEMIIPAGEVCTQPTLDVERLIEHFLERAEDLSTLDELLLLREPTITESSYKHTGAVNMMVGGTIKTYKA